ncbi:general secretion pathway protein GspK [bacterium]|nr:general secretion pathway protein GspK [bacterium]
MRDVYNLIKQNEKERGFVLLAVLAFIAFILPVILLVLSTISAETMAVGEAVKGAKAERAADQAMESAVSVLLQEKQLPDYWVSKTQERNAIIVDNGRGFRRDGLVNGGAGLDGVYGTNDDYWIGPRKDRSYIAGDDTTDPRNYDYDFRYLNGDGPVYLAQRWAYNFFRNPYYYQPVNLARVPLEFYNQFAAVEGDADGDGVNEGFNPDSLDQLLFPGYYPAAFPPVGPYESDITTGATIANAMLDYRTKLYEGIYENLDQGPVPSTLTRAYGSVTDESGRINLNIFCKKVRVWTEESSLYDTRFWDNSVTDDFNNNNMPGEWGWHWIDNPLFPDRNTVLLRDQNGAVTGNIDWAGVGADGWPNNSPDGESWIALGETVQHYYAPDWVYSAIESKRMLMTLPGVNETLAENILRALNPDLSTLPNGGDEAAWTIPDADNHRVDAPNLTPALAALDVVMGGGGQITDFMFHYDWYNDDDLPLPTPRPFSDVKELLNVQGMTSTKFERLRDYVTVYSYDTNVVQNYIADVSSTVDPINPPDLPPGATSRPIPGYLVDSDTVPDLRYDINKPLADTSLSSLEQEADILMAFLRNHLPEGTYDKFALPVIDRAGRGPSDHLNSTDAWGNPFRGSWSGGYPYNVGESGHEYNINLGGGATEPGAEYPALDPPFSRDSALSILLYRHGLTQADAFRYQDGAGNPRVVHEGIPIPGTRSFIPIIDPIILIPGLLEFYFQPAHVPSPELGQNVDAVIPPHYFDSVADILEVPLYKFSRFSVGIMADPPSDYLCAPIGKDAVMVNYYVSMSDIVKLGEYDTNGTTGDLTDDTVAYTYDVYFDYNYDGTWEDVVNLSFGDDLRLVSAPPTEARPGVITTFNQSTGQRYIRFDHLFDLAEVPDPDPALAGTVAGDFAFDYFGNPFITARVMAVKAAGTPEETLADSVVKVYLQENCDTFIPLKVSILAVRISADQFMLLSRAGGGVEDPNTFRLYDWDFNGSPQGIDGTWPMQAGGRDPRTVFVTPSSDTIRLTVYDLYSPAAIGAWPGLPVIPPSTALPPGIIVANQVQPPFPAMPYPPEGVDTDVVQVDLIGTMPNVVAEVACDPPSMEEDSSTLLHLGMYGGVSPYSVAVQVFDSLGGLVQSYNYGNYESNTLTIETDAFPIQDTYNVVFTVTDSTTPIPTSAIDATTLIVGGRGSPARSFTNVPNMTASINLHEVDQPNHGFRASVSVSGGRGEYGYLWQVFDEFGALAHGDQGQVLDSNDASPTFLFNPDQSQDGVYFVKVMVIDQKNVNPHNATNTVLATDTEMVIVGGPGSYDREPIATLAAIPPGNGEDAIGDNNLTAVMSGTGPQPYLSSDAGVPPVVPEIAGHGSIIEIYGYNFSNIPQNNRVTFGGGATALAFSVQPDPSYAGPLPFRQILQVVVPGNARTGWLTVTTDDGAGNGGTSGHAFFQTHFVVSFDLIGSIIPDTEHNYTMELDFQGDGIIDARADTSRMADSPGQVRQSQLTSLHHDYADDGFGNYTATLIVTDQGTGKSAVSHQLVQIRNLRPLVEDPNNTPEAYGLTTSIMPMYSDRYPLPGMGINVRSYTGGVTSHTGLKYKWNVDGNSRYAILTESPDTPTYWEVEPNDTSPTANVMPLDYDPATDNATWTGRTADAADDDWFSIDTSQAGTLSILMECVGLVGVQHIDIALYDSSLVLIDSGSIGAGGTYAWATTGRNSPADTYYIRIDADSTQTYELESIFTPNPGNTFWESEPNDDSASADVMGLSYDPDRDSFPFTGTIPPAGPADEDWYSITTTQDGTLNVLVQSFDQGPADELYVRLFDAALGVLDSGTIASGDSCNVVGTGSVMPAGTFYVRVWGNSANQRYNIDPSFIAQGFWGGGGPVNINVSSSISADGRFVSPGVSVNYYAQMAFNFTTTDPTIFDIGIDESVPLVFDWDIDGDGISDYVAPANYVTSELYVGHAGGSAGFTFINTGSYNTGRLNVSGSLLITDRSNNRYSQAFTLPQPAPLPTVDVSNVLSTLSLPTLGNDNRHLIALTVINEDYDMATGRARVVHASDTIVIPSAENPQADVHAYLATQDPYSLTNVPGSLTYTLTGIYGQGSDMRFMADLNTDGHFEIGVLGFPNPQTHSRVTATNGLNRMNPGAINSFPTILPGVWFQFINIGIDVEADKGIYEAAALVRDNPLNPGDIPAYAFDSQVVFVGGNRGGGSASPLPLAVDTFIDPMVGVTTQGFSLESFVSGGAWPYTYNWSILHVDTGTAIQFSDGSQHFVPNPLFVPSEDAFDELGALVTGTYQVRLVVSDANGMLVVGQPRLIVVEQAPLNAQIMAIPPSVAVDEQVNFVVYVDGGMPPYDITVTYNDPNNPGASDSVTTSGRYTFFQYRYDAVWMDRTSPANGRYDDPEDGVNVQITVTDANGDIVSPATHPFNAEQKVLVGERLPLNVTAVVSPSSGVSNFQVQVNYAVGGGRKFGGSSFGNMVTSGAATGLSGLFGEDSDYFVVVSLVSTDGSLVDMEFRDSRTTIINPYGADGIMMNGDTGELYDPVYLYVPYPGNYYVVVFVTDGAGEFAITQQQVFASGYLTPQMYGSTVPKVRRDRDGRPLHAVRVWVDPLYDGSEGGDWEDNDYRLREADIQVFGDLLTVDPNPSFISPGFLAAKDPADCPQFAINYLEDPQTDSPADFYDTYTLGRININTAPEEVLASLFSKIIKERAYFPTDGANWSRGDRDYENDRYITRDEARALAHAVVEYRNAYYDAYKPSVNGGGFDYRHGSGADPYASGDVRVDHLPVVGPWDGVNPRAADYPDPSSRDDVWPDQTDNDAINAWDNFRGIYYNLDRSVENLQFYAPSDIAVVRKQLTFETDEEYAKYLNDTLDNGTSLDGEDPWAIDQRRGFDARQYFFYDTEAGETRADARNEIALIYSGGEIAFTFIPNPPFQSVFDLYKVVGALTNDYYLDLMDWDDDGSVDEPRSFSVVDTDGDGNRDDVEVDANNFSTVERTLSGPSLFRYAEVWDAENNEFKVIANYLDDIAPYVTTRSYTFRIVGMGGVSISGGGMTAPVNADHIDRDRAIERVIDIGKMHTPRRDTTEVSADASERRAYMVLYEDRHSESGG